MGVFKEIEHADGSGITQFFRLNTEQGTVETPEHSDFYVFKGQVPTRADLPTHNLEIGDAYYIEDEKIVVFWDGGAWAEVSAYLLNYDYKESSNKPKINGHTLADDKSSSDLGLQPAGNYLTEIPSEYVTESELIAEDYANKTWVRERIAEIQHFHREIVQVLPLVGLDNVLYLVPKQGTGGDVYNEYIWTGTKYELIGTTAADLTNFYNKQETDALLLNKVDKEQGKTLTTNDFTNNYKTQVDNATTNIATLNTTVASLSSTVAGLHNYDDTEVRGDIAALESEISEMGGDIDDLQAASATHITAIRLVKAGDQWAWKDMSDSVMTYQEVADRIGYPETTIYTEGIENDGKTYPISYSMEDDHIDILVIDLNNRVHRITSNSNGTFNYVGTGAGVNYGEPVATQGNLPTTAGTGEIRKVLDTNKLYLFDGTNWMSVSSSQDVDLSNYLAKDNATPYVPTGIYNPATKGYVDTSISRLAIPTKLSNLQNDMNFVNKSVNDLTNYYTKTTTYTKTEVNNLIHDIGGTTTTLNGTVTTTPSWYAPTTPGTAGQVLISNGSGAPRWGEGGGGTSELVLPFTIVNVDEDSTSEEIIEAFGGERTIEEYFEACRTNRLMKVVATLIEADEEYCVNVIRSAYSQDENTGIKTAILSFIDGDNFVEGFVPYEYELEIIYDPSNEEYRVRNVSYIGIASEEYVDAHTGDTLPIGTIIPYSGTEIPDGYLLCNGGYVSKDAYPGLFDAIGYTYAPGIAANVPITELPGPGGNPINIGFFYPSYMYSDVFMVGDTYELYIDGTRYEAEAKLPPMGSCGFGNMSLFTPEAPDTHEDYCIILGDDYGYICRPNVEDRCSLYIPISSIELWSGSITVENWPLLKILPLFKRGQYYDFILDGTACHAQCHLFTEGAPFEYVGNLSLLDEDYPDTGETYFMGHIGKQYWQFVFTEDTSHVFSMDNSEILLSNVYLPDLTGYVIGGAQNEDESTLGTGNDFPLGSTYGSYEHDHHTNNHTLTVEEIPSHLHGLNTNVGATGFGSNNSLVRGSGGTTEWKDNTAYIKEVGGGQSHNHGYTDYGSSYQPTFFLNYIIKASMVTINISRVEDSLESESTTNALSARCGKILNDKLNKAILPKSGNIGEVLIKSGDKDYETEWGKAIDVQELVDYGFDYKQSTAPTVYTLTNISTHPFEINSDGYYESTNKGVDNSCSLCKLTFNYSYPITITIEYIDYGENTWDYGIFSNIDKELINSKTDDGPSGSENVKRNDSGLSSPKTKTIVYEIPSGEHFIEIKYRKDGSVSTGNDSLQFKILNLPITVRRRLALEQSSKDGTNIFGWYHAMRDGENVTASYGITPEHIESCLPGSKFEWPSTVSSTGRNNAIITSSDVSYGYKSGGGIYYWRDIVIRNNTYTYAYDDVEVRKGTWDSPEPVACFAAGTPIYTKKGLINIEDIEEDDKVMTVNHGMNIIEPHRVEDILHHPVNSLLSITVGDECIEVTESHPFWVIEKGKTRADDLEVGDLLVDDKNNTYPITKIETIEKNIEVYEILLEGTRNYFVGKNHYQVFNEFTA